MIVSIFLTGCEDASQQISNEKELHSYQTVSLADIPIIENVDNYLLLGDISSLDGEKYIETYRYEYLDVAFENCNKLFELIDSALNDDNQLRSLYASIELFLEDEQLSLTDEYDSTYNANID